MDVAEDTLSIRMRNTGNVVSVDRATWDKVEYEYDKTSKKIVSSVVGTFTQFPVCLGWAMTIHKSQGMTIDSVRIDMGRGAFCSGQAYVALSRCRSIEGIELSKPLKLSDIRVDPRVRKFYAGFIPPEDHQTTKENKIRDLPPLKKKSTSPLFA